MERLFFVLLSLGPLLCGANASHNTRYNSELDDWRPLWKAGKRQTTPDEVHRVKRQSDLCRSAVDVVFVVDSSGSIRGGNPSDGSYDNWDLILEFIIGLVRQLDIGKDASRVGMVTYSNQAFNSFYLNDYYNREELIAKIRATTYYGGTTNTSGGLRVMIQQQFNASRGDRPTINNVGIVITDGASNEDIEFLTPAAMDVEERGIIMFAIGITKAVNSAELARISSYPHRVNENWWTHPNFTTVNKILGQVSTAVCDMATVSTPTGCEADVVFTVDASDSINHRHPGNWQVVLQFLRRLAIYIASNSTTTRIGMSRFSDSGDIISSFREFGNLSNFISIINSMEYIGGLTNTADGLRSAQDIFSQDRRAGVKRILIIITDGKPTKKIGQEVNVAETIRKDGIRIVALGVTYSIDQNTLNALTGDPQLVVRSENFEALPEIIAPLLKMACATQPVITTPSLPTSNGGNTVFDSCRSQVDIVFVVDSSGSIRSGNPPDGSYDNWDLILQFIIGLVQQLDIGQDASRVGLVTYSDQAFNSFFLNDYYNKEELIAKIRATTYYGGRTNTSGGLRVMIQQQFRVSRGDRPTVNNVGIVITDGESNDDVALLAPAALDAQQRGIKMFAIGITYFVNTMELANISSYPHRVNENWWTHPNFTSVNKIVGQVTKAVCDMATVSTPTGCDADVVFMVDASRSIERQNPGNWEVVLQFLRRLAVYIASNSTTTRIGMSRFSDSGDIISSFREFGNLSNFKSIINSMGYIGGFTNTADGLRSAQDIFSQDRRAGVKRILIIITDGKPTLNIGQEVPVAETIRKDGIRIVALGVTDSIDQDTLNALTGDPRLVVRSENFEALPGIIAQLLNVACATQPVITTPSLPTSYGGNAADFISTSVRCRAPRCYVLVTACVITLWKFSSL